MKVLYVEPGYKGIYTFFDDWIKAAAAKISLDFFSLSPSVRPTDLAEIIHEYKPNIILMILATKIPLSLIEVIKNSNIPVAVWLTEDPFYLDTSLKILPFADLILTIDKGSTNYYRTLGYHNVHLFPLATNEHIFKPLNASKDKDLLLVGYPYPKRLHIVDHLLSQSSYSIRLIGEEWKKKLKSKHRKSRQIEIIDRWISPSEVNLYYNKSKIIINPHREFDFILNRNQKRIRNCSVNNRFFDIYSSGGFQLIDESIELPEHLSLPYQISFTDLDGCLKKIDWYMQNPMAMQEIAKIGRHKTLESHTFQHRLEQFITIIENRLLSSD